MKDKPQPILKLVHSSVVSTKILKTPEEIYTEAEIDKALGQLALNTLSEGKEIPEFFEFKSDHLPTLPINRQGLPRRSPKVIFLPISTNKNPL